MNNSTERIPTKNTTYTLSTNPEVARVATITGTMGVGKGYILEALKGHPDISPTIRIASFGSLLAELIGIDRDRLREINPETISQLQLEVAAKIQTMTSLILDSHVFFAQNGVRVLNTAVEEIIRPAHYIMVAAEPATVLERRISGGDATDPTKKRVRVSETVDQIQMHQQLILAILHVLSTELGTGLTVIRNDDTSNIHENQQTLLRILDEEKI